MIIKNDFQIIVERLQQALDTNEGTIKINTLCGALGREFRTIKTNFLFFQNMGKYELSETMTPLVKFIQGNPNFKNDYLNLNQIMDFLQQQHLI